MLVLGVTSLSVCEKPVTRGKSAQPVPWESSTTWRLADTVWLWPPMSSWTRNRTGTSLRRTAVPKMGHANPPGDPGSTVTVTREVSSWLVPGEPRYCGVTATRVPLDVVSLPSKFRSVRTPVILRPAACSTRNVAVSARPAPPSGVDCDSIQNVSADPCAPSLRMRSGRGGVRRRGQDHRQRAADEGGRRDGGDVLANPHRSTVPVAELAPKSWSPAKDAE